MYLLDELSFKFANLYEQCRRWPSKVGKKIVQTSASQTTADAGKREKEVAANLHGPCVMVERCATVKWWNLEELLRKFHARNSNLNKMITLDMEGVI